MDADSDDNDDGVDDVDGDSDDNDDGDDDVDGNVMSW